MATVSQRATLEDLYRTTGKAELIGGRIHYMATGVRPNEVEQDIPMSALRFRFLDRGAARPPFDDDADVRAYEVANVGVLLRSNRVGID